jgi:hypothetical protein
MDGQASMTQGPENYSGQSGGRKLRLGRFTRTARFCVLNDGQLERFFIASMAAVSFSTTFNCSHKCCDCARLRARSVRATNSFRATALVLAELENRNAKTIG